MQINSLVIIVVLIAAVIAASSTRIGFFEFNKIFRISFLIGLLSILGKFRWKIYIIFKTLPRDIKFLYRYVHATREIKSFVRNNLTIVKIFRERAKRYPEQTCFISAERIWTNADINKYGNQIASIFQKAGYVKGDVVALMVPNSPEYVAIWVGLGKLGIITALINTNLRVQSLVHCITIAKAKSIIYSEEYSSAIDEIHESIPTVAKYELCSKPETKCDGGAYNLLDVMSKASTEEPVVKEDAGYRDTILYVYTSGTTGLPKVAVIPHARVLLIGAATYNMLALRSTDIVYNTNPLYHITGGIIGVCCALNHGIPTVLKPKFSVKAYWTDCAKYKCTVALYIGEMCRYLLNTPPRPEDTAHSLRFIVGNGMKPHIWCDFVKRFKIQQVCEIYGSSEGNANMINVDNQTGAIGMVPSILPKSLHPIAIIRVEEETYEPIRGPDGLCIRTEPNETGMLIGLIKEKLESSRFSGYLDKETSEKKIVRNVFTKGDKAFLTGDLLVQDEYGYFYFKDRVGDTFRWKGETVSTVEVEAIINTLTNHKDVIVFGVQVPGMEGKAGMAVIADPENRLDFKDFATNLDKTLPFYAKPVFVRIVKELELTGTLKPKKINFQREGFDPSKIQDKLYFRESNQEYVRITPQLYQEIVAGLKKF